MKKTIAVILAVLMMLSLAACGGGSSGSETQSSKGASAKAGDVTFDFNQDGQFLDLKYKYPDTMELEKDESHPRDMLRYHADGYDPAAFSVVISRREGWTPEEVVKELLSSDDAVITSEEINGVTYTVGTLTTGSGTKVILYSRAAGDDAYSMSFPTDYPDDFDLAEFARVFVANTSI